MNSKQITPLGEDETLPPEDFVTRGYRGVGNMHYIKNTNPHSAADKKYYFVVVNGVGRGRQRLMLTDKEVEEAEQRYYRNREDSPEPKTFWGKLLSGELWRFAK